MQLLWGQIITHIVGFIIAVFILKRFAWGPILRLLEERRARIQGEFDRIDQEKQRVEGLKQEYDGKLRGIEAQARLRIQEAVQEGQKVGADIREQARQDAHHQMARAEEQIEQERAKAHVTLRNDMVDLVVGATERLIQERLDDEKHRRLIADFIASLDTLESGGRASP